MIRRQTVPDCQAPRCRSQRSSDDFKWGEHAGLTAMIGAINVYDRTNLFYYDLYTLRRINQLPLIPYIAIEVKAD